MDVSIIIVNYKTLPLIVNCINSIIQKSTGISYEIIVVDNNSSDNFSECLKEKFGSLVTCVQLAENIGFGRANNEGVKIAKGRNILFLNPDTLLINNAIKILSDYLDANPKVGACGGNLYNEDMSPVLSYSMLLPSIEWELNLLSGSLLEKMRWGKNAQFNHSNLKREVGYITGADMMVRYSVLDKVGCFSKHFFMYYEDSELAYRIKRTGYLIVSVPDARIQHLVGKSLGGKVFNPKRILFVERGLSIFYLLHKNRTTRYVLMQLRLLRLNIKYYFVHKKKFSADLYKKCVRLIREEKIENI